MVRSTTSEPRAITTSNPRNVGPAAGRGELDLCERPALRAPSTMVSSFSGTSTGSIVAAISVLHEQR